VQYNVDGQASPNAALVSGSTYNWSVTVQDADGNQAKTETTYTP
jgi:VCBS repeat-containing protein